jgi:hypothetical protein
VLIVVSGNYDHRDVDAKFQRRPEAPEFGSCRRALGVGNALRRLIATLTIFWP